MELDKKLPLCIFKPATTYLDSYRPHHGIYKIIPDYSRTRTEKTPKPPPTDFIAMDSETHTPLRKKVPMSLTIIPNEITRGNPHKMYTDTVLPSDLEKEKVIKTRPKQLLTPQVSLDEVPDPEMKKKLLHYMYTTNFRQAEAEVFSMSKKEYKDPSKNNTLHENNEFLRTVRQHNFSVKFKPNPLLATEMTENLNRKGATWTNEQLIGLSNADELFWKKHNMKLVGDPVDNLNKLVDESTKQEIEVLVKQDRLRLPHDKKYPGHIGFHPELARGVTLEKKDLSCLDPLLSTEQVMSKRKLKKSDIRT